MSTQPGICRSAAPRGALSPDGTHTAGGQPYGQGLLDILTFERQQPRLVDAAALAACTSYREAVRACWDQRVRRNLSKALLAEGVGCYAPHVTDYLAEAPATARDAARFDATGQGEWLELSFADLRIAQYGAYKFVNQGDVLVNARHAADAVGATKMDRPEKGAVNHRNGEIYFALTSRCAGGSLSSGGWGFAPSAKSIASVLPSKPCLGHQRYL